MSAADIKVTKDGRRDKTYAVNSDQLLRIIRSVPSGKAEPFKLWLAEAGRERIEEILDPEHIAERLVVTCERKDHTREWIIQQCLIAICARKDLTDERNERGTTQGKEYVLLTDEPTKSWSGRTTRQDKNHKGLKKVGLWDNGSTSNLTLN